MLTALLEPGLSACVITILMHDSVHQIQSGPLIAVSHEWLWFMEIF